MSGRPRGRPLSFDTTFAIDRMLPLLRAKGSAATPLDDLAAAAGLNRANLYAGFGSKQVIYLMAVERFRRTLRDDVGAALVEAVPVADSLTSFFDKAVDIYAEDGLGCLVFGTAVAECGDTKVRAVIAEVIAEIDDALQRRLDDAQQQGEIRADVDIAALAVAFSALLNSLSTRARSGTPARDLRALHRRVTRQLLQVN